jgi:CheY-like chemotaxis protein
LQKLFPKLSTRAVHSGEEFMAYLQGQDGFSDRTEFPYPILVLLDLKMGGLDGFDVLRWLRDNPPHNYVPVIVLTVSGEVQLVKRAYALGARSFLTKPLGANELRNAVCGLQDWLALVRSQVLLASR